MSNVILIRYSDKAQKIIDNLRPAGRLADVKVIDGKSQTIENYAKSNVDVLYFEAGNGLTPLGNAAMALGWRKFRMFLFGLTDGEDTAEFYLCIGERSFSAFPPYIFNKDFTLEKFESYIR